MKFHELKQQLINFKKDKKLSFFIFLLIQTLSNPFSIFLFVALYYYYYSKLVYYDTTTLPFYIVAIISIFIVILFTYIKKNYIRNLIQEFLLFLNKNWESFSYSKFNPDKFVLLDKGFKITGKIKGDYLFVGANLIDKKSNIIFTDELKSFLFVNNFFSNVGNIVIFLIKELIVVLYLFFIFWALVSHGTLGFEPLIVLVILAIIIIFLTKNKDLAIVLLISSVILPWLVWILLFLPPENLEIKFHKNKKKCYGSYNIEFLVKKGGKNSILINTILNTFCKRNPYSRTLEYLVQFNKDGFFLGYNMVSFDTINIFSYLDNFVHFLLFYIDNLKDLSKNHIIRENLDVDIIFLFKNKKDLKTGP